MPLWASSRYAIQQPRLPTPISPESLTTCFRRRRPGPGREIPAEQGHRTAGQRRNHPADRAGGHAQGAVPLGGGRHSPLKANKDGRLFFHRLEPLDQPARVYGPGHVELSGGARGLQAACAALAASFVPVSQITSAVRSRIDQLTARH
jgi:hypothetical protein